jgi:hypothetical protein
MSVHSKLAMLVEDTQLLSAVPNVTSDYAIPVISE